MIIILWCISKQRSATRGRRFLTPMKRRFPDEDKLVEEPLPKRPRVIERIEAQDLTESDFWTVIADRHLTLASRASLLLTCRALEKLIKKRGKLVDVLMSAVVEDESPALYVWLRRRYPLTVLAKMSQEASPMFTARMWSLSATNIAIIKADFQLLKTQLAAPTGAAWRTVVEQARAEDRHTITAWCLATILSKKTQTDMICDILYYDVPDLYAALPPILAAQCDGHEMHVQLPILINLADRCARFENPPTTCTFLATHVLPRLANALCFLPTTLSVAQEDFIFNACVELLEGLALPLSCPWCVTTIKREVVPALFPLREMLLKAAARAIMAPHTPVWMLAVGEITRLTRAWPPPDSSLVQS
jgi:hypothetical protein